MKEIVLLRPGLVPYAEALRLQQEIQFRVISGQSPETLLLLEHPPTITIGKSGSEENVLASRRQLAGDGVSLYYANRGGDVTGHGPGQIVIYPILDLTSRGRDARLYIHQLEEVLLRTLLDFDITGVRDAGHAGIWIDNREIAAIGIGLRRWVTIHGAALNVNTPASLFSLINPCGFRDRQAVSMSRILNKKVDEPAVRERLLVHFSNIFESALVERQTGGTGEEEAAVLV